jgi:hypothetical protein
MIYLRKILTNGNLTAYQDPATGKMQPAKKRFLKI